MENSLALAPQRLLEQAAELQKVVYPDDNVVLERLFHCLELNRPMLAEIRAAVCEFYAVDPEELCGRRRDPEIVRTRQVFCFLAYRYTRFSHLIIARRVGLVDHTSARHAVRKIERLAVTQARMADELDLLRLRLAEKVLRRAVEFGRC
jgi:chromosomal replication initiation ATPase DnaA